MAKEPRRIYIREAAQILDRKMGTLRKWEQHKILPKHLMPKRGERGWRYWTEDQVAQIKEWIRDTDRRPGKGLPHYNPTAKQLEDVFAKLRRPRSDAKTESKN